jgi:hypothetical protein
MPRVLYAVERDPGTHGIETWIGTEAGMGVLETNKVSLEIEPLTIPLLLSVLVQTQY